MTRCYIILAVDTIIKWNTHCMKICIVIINYSALFSVSVSENFCTVCCLWLIKANLLYVQQICVMCIFVAVKIFFLALDISFTWDILMPWSDRKYEDNSCQSQPNSFSILYSFKAVCFGSWTIRHHQTNKTPKKNYCVNCYVNHIRWYM